MTDGAVRGSNHAWRAQWSARLMIVRSRRWRRTNVDPVGRRRYVAARRAVTLSNLGRSQVVRQRILIPPCGGSNPPAPANHFNGLPASSVYVLYCHVAFMSRPRAKRARRWPVFRVRLYLQETNDRKCPWSSGSTCDRVFVAPPLTPGRTTTNRAMITRPWPALPPGNCAIACLRPAFPCMNQTLFVRSRPLPRVSATRPASLVQAQRTSNPLRSMLLGRPSKSHE